MTKNSTPSQAPSDSTAVATAKHRQLLVLSGSQEWAQQEAQQFVNDAETTDKNILWLGEAAQQTGCTVLPARAASRILGREFQLIIFNAFDGFDVDAFGMVSGTIVGGGKLLLLCPPLDEWAACDDPASKKLVPHGSKPSQHSRFLQRAVHLLRDNKNAKIVEESSSSRPPIGVEDRLRPVSMCGKLDSGRSLSRAQPQGRDDEETTDQSRAIQAIIRAGKSRARRPVVLTADRGRGKSTALGLAAAKLLQEEFADNGDIIITAPRPAACEQAFIHAARLLQQASRENYRLSYNGKTLRYLAPDVLAYDAAPDNKPPRLVMVDEAAAIPAPLLRRLLQRFPRTVFSTTVHGYEGTGRGFALRFRNTLDTLTPDWKAVSLKTPVRWAEDDPLEAVTAKLLLLNAEAAEDEEVAAATAGNCNIFHVDRDNLVSFAACDAAPTKEDAIKNITPVIPALRLRAGRNDKRKKNSFAGLPILNELFGLLMLAHYRTRPFDLRLLLDAPNIRVYCARHNGHIVAVALVALEGGLGEDLANAVCYGKRRPQGHLLPETLAAQAGFADAVTLKAARVLRIAVHPAAQGRGLGSALLKHIGKDLQKEVDYLGAVFGATSELLRFWQQAGFTPAWMGTRRGKSTGEHAGLVMQPVSDAGRKLTDAVKKQFCDNLLQQLCDPHGLADLEPELSCALLQSYPAPPPPDKGDWQAIETFAHGNRPFENVLAPVSRLTYWAVSQPALDLNARQITVLVTRVIQRQTWQQVAKVCDVPGKPQALTLLREACAHILHVLQDKQ